MALGATNLLMDGIHHYVAEPYASEMTGIANATGVDLGMVPAQVSTTSREPNIKLRALFMSQ